MIWRIESQQLKCKSLLPVGLRSVRLLNRYLRQLFSLILLYFPLPSFLLTQACPSLCTIFLSFFSNLLSLLLTHDHFSCLLILSLRSSYWTNVVFFLLTFSPLFFLLLFFASSIHTISFQKTYPRRSHHNLLWPNGLKCLSSSIVYFVRSNPQRTTIFFKYWNNIWAL